MARAFIPNPGFEQQLLRSRQVVPALERAVKAGVDIAQENAPERLGFLKGGIKGVVGLGPNGFQGRVISTDFKTIWWEYGHNNQNTGRFEQQPFLRPVQNAFE